MDGDIIALGIILFLFVGIPFLLVAWLPAMDFSSIDAVVKVQEVGTKHLFMGIGEYKFIRVQNAFSEQFSSSSESWEACIDKEDAELFQQYKNNRTVVNIKVDGIGWSSRWGCATGDKVVEFEGVNK